MNISEENRSRSISIRLSDEEMAILKKKAAEANMSESRLIKNAIRYGGAYGVRNFSEEDRARLGHEVDRIGNNLLQIDWVAHGSDGVDKQEWSELRDGYLRLLSEFFRFVQE